MTATITDRLADVDAGPLLLPERPRRFGPTSRRLLARLVVALALVELVGTAARRRRRQRSVAGVRVGARLSGCRVAVRRRRRSCSSSPRSWCSIALVLWWGLSTHFSIPLVWFGTAVAGCRAGRRAATLGRARHHVGLGDPRRLRLCARGGGDDGVEDRAPVPHQAGDGARAERLPRRRADPRTGDHPAPARPHGRRAPALVLRRSPSNPTTASPASTGASSSTAAHSCATSSTASPGRCRCTPRTTCPTRRGG